MRYFNSFPTCGILSVIIVQGQRGQGMTRETRLWHALRTRV